MPACKSDSAAQNRDQLLRAACDGTATHRCHAQDHRLWGKLRQGAPEVFFLKMFFMLSALLLRCAARAGSQTLLNMALTSGQLVPMILVCKGAIAIVHAMGSCREA